MHNEVLGQCAECQYTETLHLTASGKVVQTITFARRGNRLVHTGCGGEVRTWTGKPYAFRAKGIL